MYERLLKEIARLRRCESGATLVEYGIAVLVAVTVGTVALTGLATDINEAMFAAGHEMPETGETADAAGTTYTE